MKQFATEIYSAGAHLSRYSVEACGKKSGKDHRAICVGLARSLPDRALKQ